MVSLRKQDPEAPPAPSLDPEMDSLYHEWVVAELDHYHHAGGSAYHHVMMLIASAYESHGQHWGDWLKKREVPKTRAKGPFHALLKHLASINGPDCLENAYGVRVPRASKGWITRVADTLTEWAEVARYEKDEVLERYRALSRATRMPSDVDDFLERHFGEATYATLFCVAPTDLNEWLHGFPGHINGVYEARKRRLDEQVEKGQKKSVRPVYTREERETMYHAALTAPDQPVTIIPDELAGHDGEYVAAVRLDAATGNMIIRAVWQPDPSFWLRNADRMVPMQPASAASLRSAEHPALRGEAPQSIGSDDPVARLDRIEARLVASGVPIV